jgi:hypothetical protein
LHPGSGDIISSAALDLALIPLNMPLISRQVRERCMTLSTSGLNLETELFGSSLQDGHPVVQYCRVLEWDKNGTAQTNCGGVAGFSGTAYTNREGFMVAIHAADGEFLHAAGDGGERTRDEGFSHTLSQTWENTTDHCTRSRAPLSNECMDGLFRTMKLSERNPRTEVADASCFFALLKPNVPHRCRPPPKGDPEYGVVMF